MDQSRRQRFAKKPKKHNHLFIILVAILLILAAVLLLLMNHRHQQQVAKQAAVSSSRVLKAKQTSEAKAKSRLEQENKRTSASGNATFTNDTYVNHTFTIKLTGGKIITDTSNTPVLLIQYTLTNHSKKAISPSQEWAALAQLKQVPTDKQTAVSLKNTTSVQNDLDDADKNLIATTAKPVPAKQSIDGAIPFTLVSKSKIELQMLDPTTHKVVGKKTYNITG